MKTEILYEDSHILVCYKQAGMAVQTRQIGQIDVESELRNYLSGKPVYVVHRLDQPVEGIQVFARNKKAAAHLSAQLPGDEMNKIYMAVVCGQMPEKKREGTLEDYLVKESKGNLSRVAGKNESGAKYSVLTYQTVAQKKLAEIDPAAGFDPDEVLTLLRIRLKTGRHHQIRVQLSHAGFPLLSDYKYAGKRELEISGKLGVSNVALCAKGIQFVHPVTNQKMNFEICPKGLSFQYFHDIISGKDEKKRGYLYDKN